MAKPLVLLKVPGGVFKERGEFGFSRKAMKHIADEVVSVRRNAYLAILIGGFVHGRDLKESLGLGDKGVSVDEAGILATIMNAKLFQAFLDQSHKTSSQIFVPPGVHSLLSGEVFQESKVRGYLHENIANGAVALLAGGLGEPGLRTDMAMVTRAYQLGARHVFNGDPKPMDGEARAFADRNELSVHQFDILERGAFKERLSKAFAPVEAS
jgi:uridylate kinase